MKFLDKIKLPQDDWAKAFMWVGIAWAAAFTITSLPAELIALICIVTAVVLFFTMLFRSF